MPTFCPFCQRRNDMHVSATSPAPTDGDVSIWWGCRRVAVFVDTPFGLQVRRPTPEEQAEIDATPEIRAALAAATESYTPAQAADLLRER